MHRSRLVAISVFALGALSAASNCWATTITATTLSAWKQELTGSPTDVDSSPLHIGNSYNTSAGVTLSGFVFTGPDAGSYKLSVQQYSGYTSLFGSTDAGAGINVATPAGGETAIAFSAASTAGTALNLLLSDGETFSFHSGFYGLALSHPITSFLLSTTSGSQAVIEYVSYGVSSLPQDSPGNPGASATPEASPLILFALGLLILAVLRRPASKRINPTVNA